MVEEIKKEIEINTIIVDDYYDYETEVICKEVLFEILDKYKNQEEKYICKHLKFCKDGFNLDGDCVWEEYTMMANGNMKLHLKK